MRRLVFAFVLLLTAIPAFAIVRLPQTVIPDHYAIRIAPDLRAETFSGTETIDVDVKEPVDSITLHSIDLVLKDVTVEAAGKQLPATVTTDAPNETVTFKVAQTIPPGRAAIHVSFDGKLLPQLRGLYLSKTAKRNYAVTQFEAMSARRAFPCFDEPAMKATFDITLVVDKGDTAISNGPIVADTPEGDAKHAIRFGTTKKMSTYLVAMLVGDFQCISGSADDVPIRVCSTPGLQNLGNFALQAAEASVKFFDGYYGIPYPFGKLDLIGIPDFAAGAMENAGAITFRETDLLADEKTASVLALKRVAEVVSHEIAHQWFGDLVTMQWWNDIWLNEGFATFMSEKPIAAWKPEWHLELDKPVQTDTALTVDSQLSTRPIRAKEMEAGGGAFDATITYDKTSSVLRMVEEWIGPDAFRDAIRAYLRKYSWGNAAAEDFWGVMKQSTNQPTDAVLQSFIDHTGAPLLHVMESCDANMRRVTISQTRMLPDGATAPSETWTIPVCVSGSSPCHLVTTPSETLDRVFDCDHPTFLSRNGQGYFVVDYPSAERAAIRSNLASLNDSERIWYNGNEWLLARFNHNDVSGYLDLVRAMPRTNAPEPLVTAITNNLVYLDQRLVTPADRPKWQAFVRDALRGYAPFTWEAPAGESGEQRIVRADVLWTLGYAGDPQVIAGARRVADRYMKDPASADALIADRALRISAVYGDTAFFNRVVEHLEKAPTPELANRYRALLSLFRDPQAEERAIAYIYSDKVRLQDLPLSASTMFTDPATRPAAWAAAKSRWEDLQKRSFGSVGRIAGATSNFCDPESRRDVEAFFQAHPMRMGQRTLNRALESIDTCVAFRAAQQKHFDEALGSK